eukprot:TRINITY_DN11141_c0_g1_i1.p1 TRINITY_DN11141_c0_g1~~TRINITY_DN11141_c0_g1_i1.p1  ORF type:complete len:330 (-),score=56.53 TRINITY_DN11141_c0_g1_i1:88-1077(-)
MEVNVEAMDNSLPAGTFIAVRVGDVQKQTQYDPLKTYRFPEARRFGKVDVYQRVGTCDLTWGAEEPETRTCKAIGPTGDTGIRLKVAMSRPPKGAVVKEQPQEASTKVPKKEASASAKRYLQENDVEGILTGAMRALLKTMPMDAPTFLCDYIRRQYGRTEPSKAHPAAFAGACFKGYYQRQIAPTSGKLCFAAIHRRFPACAAAKKEAPTRALVSRPWSNKPSIGTWLARTAEPPEEKEEILKAQKLERPAWFRCASVGTWLAPIPPPEDKPEELKMCHKPSVGTWLSKKSAREVRWLKEKRVAMLPGHMKFGSVFASSGLSPGVFLI